MLPAGVPFRTSGKMPKRSQTSHLVIHCSATPPSMDVGVEWVDRVHRARGFFSCGYAHVIRRDGTIELGRGWDAVGGHAKTNGFNRKSPGICLVGGVSEKPLKHIPGNPWNGSDAQDNFTDAQFQSMFELIKEGWERYGSMLPVIGHRDIPSVTKACPSFSVAEKMLEMFPDEYASVYPNGFPSRWED